MQITGYSLEVNGLKQANQLLSSEHFPPPSLVDTPIPEQQLQHRVTHNYAKPKELQRLTVSPGGGLTYETHGNACRKF